MAKNSGVMRVSPNFKRYVKGISKSTGKSSVDITDELANGGVQVNIVIQKKSKKVNKKNMFNLEI